MELPRPTAMVDDVSVRTTDKAAAPLALHQAVGFVIPNAWDGGSARIL